MHKVLYKICLLHHEFWLTNENQTLKIIFCVKLLIHYSYSARLYGSMGCPKNGRPSWYGSRGDAPTNWDKINYMTLLDERSVRYPLTLGMETKMFVWVWRWKWECGTIASTTTKLCTLVFRRAKYRASSWIGGRIALFVSKF